MPRNFQRLNDARDNLKQKELTLAGHVLNCIECQMNKDCYAGDLYRQWIAQAKFTVQKESHVS